MSCISMSGSPLDVMHITANVLHYISLIYKWRLYARKCSSQPPNTLKKKLFIRKLHRGPFGNYRWKNVLWSFWLKCCKTFWILDCDLKLWPVFLSIHHLSVWNGLLFWKSRPCENLLVALLLVESSCHCRFFSCPIRKCSLITETYNHHTFLVPIFCHFRAIMSIDKEKCDFLHCSPVR